jgi:hypothetical protein
MGARRFHPLLRLTSLFAVGAVVIVAAGCGSKFDLPTERPQAKPIPSDGSYQMLSTWKTDKGGSTFDGIQDILLTQGPGSQLFFLFNHGGTGGPGTSRGEVKLYAFSNPTEIGAPYFAPPKTLFNPIALSSGQNRLFILDQGDSCQAKFDVRRGTCEADPDASFQNGHPYPSIVLDYRAAWRVREFGLGGGDTLSTFTDTTMAQVFGIASDDQGYVYVSGIAAVLDTNTIDPRIRTRQFSSRIIRYARGPRYPGVIPADRYMPGATWHRDTTWLVVAGSGASSVSDPRGLSISRGGVPSLVVADRGNNEVKTLSINQPNVGFAKMDGSTTGANFDEPVSVAADLQGYVYIVDRNNKRVLRYDSIGNWVQTVNVEKNADGLPLLDPVAVGVDDSLAYIADRGRGQVIRFKRRR